MSDEEPSEEAEREPAAAEPEPEPETAKAEAEADDARPKKKKKAKKADADTAEAEGEELDLRAKRIASAFEAGDFARVRELGAELIKSDDPKLADVGRDYLQRVAVDPVQLVFLGLCALALVAIAWTYIPH